MGSVLYLYWSIKCDSLGHAIVQVDFCRILTMEAWVLSQASTYDICGGQNVIQAGFFLSTLAFLCQLLCGQSFNLTLTRS
jgi:hypothetical protein